MNEKQTAQANSPSNHERQEPLDHLRGRADSTRGADCACLGFFVSFWAKPKGNPSEDKVPQANSTSKQPKQSRKARTA